jgi:hypothetical protein
MKTILSLALVLFSMVTFISNTKRHVSANNSSTCLPEYELNLSILHSAITEPELASIWTETGITGITTQNVSYVFQSDPKCDSLISKYEFWINEKYPDSNINMNKITFHKYSNYYLVVMSYNMEGGYLVLGSKKLYILDQNLDTIEGYGF